MWQNRAQVLTLGEFKVEGIVAGSAARANGSASVARLLVALLFAVVATASSADTAGDVVVTRSMLEGNGVSTNERRWSWVLPGRTYDYEFTWRDRDDGAYEWQEAERAESELPLRLEDDIVAGRHYVVRVNATDSQSAEVRRLRFVVTAGDAGMAKATTTTAGAIAVTRAALEGREWAANPGWEWVMPGRTYQYRLRWRDRADPSGWSDLAFGEQDLLLVLMDGVVANRQYVLRVEATDTSSGELRQLRFVARASLAGALRSVVRDRGLTGDPSAGRSLPNIAEPLPQLGMQLFFSKALGGDQDAACVTCHHPSLGGGDARALPIGVGAVSDDLLGPTRQHATTAHGYDGGPTVPRNSPTTFNIGLWDAVLFHDGRVESLTKTAGRNGAGGGIRTPDTDFGQADSAEMDNLPMGQARFPVTSGEEMRGFVFEKDNDNDAVRSHLVARLRDATSPIELTTNRWLAAFRTGLGQSAGTAEELITFPNISRAIAAYQRSQVFVQNAFRSFIEGDDEALADDAKIGALLFYGKAGCGGCHSGDFFSDEGFHVLAMPQIGRGKGDDNGEHANDDFGRFRETGVEKDRYAFRTPSLLNVSETAPYSHAGAYDTLADTVRHHIDPQTSVNSYDTSQLEPGTQTDTMAVNTGFALRHLANLRGRGESKLPEVALTDAEVGQLVGFLESLTDPCLRDASCRAKWVPKATLDDPDGLRVQAVGANGKRL